MNPSMQQFGIAGGTGGGNMFAELKRLQAPNKAAEWLKFREVLTRDTLAMMERKQQVRGLEGALTRPPNGQPLNLRGNVPLPDAGATAVVINYRVSPGYYGSIQFVSTQYAGNGFSEASGDLIWSLQFGGSPLASIAGVNQDYPFYNYGNINVSIGSLQNPPWAIGDGYEIRENQYIIFTVTNSLTSHVIPGGQVICSIVGWTAPL